MSREQGPRGPRAPGMRPAAIAAGRRQCQSGHRDSGSEAAA